MNNGVEKGFVLKSKHIQNFLRKDGWIKVPSKDETIVYELTTNTEVYNIILPSNENDMKHDSMIEKAIEKIAIVEGMKEYEVVELIKKLNKIR